MQFDDFSLAYNKLSVEQAVQPELIACAMLSVEEIGDLAVYAQLSIPPLERSAS